MSITNAPVSGGVTYYLRLHPATGAPSSGAVSLTWSTTTRYAPLTVTSLADLDHQPGWLKLNIGNGVPFDTVDVTIDSDPTVVFSFDLDEAGEATGVSIPLDGLSVGAHNVTVTASAAALQGTDTFQVLAVAPDYPATVPADSPPVAIPQVGVTRWVLQDPTTGGESYVFPINPSKMSNPHAGRVIATEHTTAPDGQPLTFEGAAVGVEWTIEGTVLTQEFYDTLETFLAMPRRVYLIDHLSRAWTVSLESIDWRASGRDVRYPWAHTYTLKALILAGPVQL